MGSIESFVRLCIFCKKDSIVQMSRCSFDIHVQDIIGSLVIGATLIMLHPNGLLDFEYLAQICKEKQITYMHSVPTLLDKFWRFLLSRGKTFHVNSLRSLCSSGRFSLIMGDLTL